jgi:type I restriction enzyme S subunit
MAEKEKIQEVPEGWKKASLKSISKITMGQSPSSDFVNENEIGMPFLQGNAEFTDKHPKEIFWVTKPKKIAQRMDILLSVRAPVGETNIADKTYCIGRGLSSIRFTECSDYYGWYLIQFFKNQLIKTSQGSTFTAVNKDDISAIHVIYPINYPEQHTIASILSTCDEAIEKTDVKIEKLKRIKQGLMQDLFRYGIDENGKMRSEATHRFKDSPLGRIPEEWEVVELKNVTQSYDGMRFPIKEEDRQGINGNYPYYGASGVIDWINKCKYDGEYLLLAEDGENILSHNLPIAFIARGKFWVNNHVHVYQPNNDMSILFLQAYLDTLDYASFNTSSAQPKLTASACSKLTLVKPPKIEQSRIVSVLSSADSAIEKEEAYKNKLLAIKRGLMEDLLSGKVRVNKLIKEAA